MVKKIKFKDLMWKNSRKRKVDVIIDANDFLNSLPLCGQIKNKLFYV